MEDLVIVALPSPDDPVNKYSSEKQPHLTLLYLGQPNFEPAELAHVVQYVAHAASQIRYFGLEVERRGELGPKHADVLFFSKPWAKEMAQFRSNLLQDQTINLAFLNADQWPEWTPHLTMGFPETPAKKDDREYNRFSYVRFDRIAVWTKDSDGPTFQLKADQHDLEVAMSEQGAAAAAEFLKHSGVKGMKWGVRRQQKKLAKADAKWEKHIYSTPGAVAVHNEVADRMNNGEIDKHNSNPKWKGKNLNDDPKLNKAYYDAYEKLNDRVYAEAVQAVHGSSPSGNKKAVYVNDEQGARIEIKSTSAKHADDDSPDLVILLKLDKLGQVIESNQATGPVKHSDADSVLEHYGVKGMRWGKKKAAVSAARSPEAKETHDIQAKARVTKVTSLSNKELQTAITRMNLEQQYTRLSPQSKKQKASKFAAEVLLGVGKQQVSRVANDVATQQVAKAMKKVG